MTTFAGKSPLFAGWSSNLKVAGWLISCGASLNKSNSSPSWCSSSASRKYCSLRDGHNRCVIMLYARQSAEYVMPKHVGINLGKITGEYWTCQEEIWTSTAGKCVKLWWRRLASRWTTQARMRRNAEKSWAFVCCARRALCCAAQIRTTPWCTNAVLESASRAMFGIRQCLQ